MTGKKLKIVIAGAGRVGLRTAQLMGERGHDVTIVECDERRARRIEEVTHAVVVCGDATRPSILEQTNVAGADVVAALTGHNGTNVAICMESEAMVEGDLWTVARVDGSKDEYDRFVDEVVFPEAAGARLTADALAFGEIQTLAELSADIEILQITVAAEAPVAGRLLQDVQLPEGAVVIARSDMDRMARGDTELEAGVRYILGVEPHAIDDVLNLFRG